MGPKLFVVAALAVAIPAPALSQASGFMLVNGTEVALGDLSIRRAGSGEWKPLATSPAPGARSQVSFKDEDCAFDIQAKASSGAVTWAGVNLCEVKSVTLRRDGSAGAWVDYDGE